MKTLNIIGCGKVAKTLGFLFSQASTYEVQDLFSRNLTSAREAARFIGAGTATANMSEMRAADVYMLTTSDDSISTFAEQLAAFKDRVERKVTFHCSGALSSNILSPLKDAGAFIASAHPVISIAKPEDSVKNFAGAFCGIEGDTFACEELDRAFKIIACNPNKDSADKKNLYHAAAVLASNYVVALLEASMQTYGEAGIDESTATKLSLSLAKSSIENVSMDGTPRALTGPIARGDDKVVETHLKELTCWNEDIASLYKAFIKITKELAGKSSEKF